MLAVNMPNAKVSNFQFHQIMFSISMPKRGFYIAKIVGKMQNMAFEESNLIGLHFQDLVQIKTHVSDSHLKLFL